MLRRVREQEGGRGRGAKPGEWIWEGERRWEGGGDEQESHREERYRTNVNKTIENSVKQSENTECTNRVNFGFSFFRLSVGEQHKEMISGNKRQSKKDSAVQRRATQGEKRKKERKETEREEILERNDRACVFYHGHASFRRAIGNVAKTEQCHLYSLRGICTRHARRAM